MNAALLVGFCLVVLLPISIHGITCYSCATCTDPINTATAEKVMLNSTTAMCYKGVVASVTTRGVMEGCIAVNSGNYGTWCCNTDLCNAGESIASLSLKRVFGTIVLAVGMMGLIRM